MKNKLALWIETNAKESVPREHLYSALLDGRFFAFFMKRSRLLMVSILIQVAFHAARYTLIAQKFPIFDFSLYFAYLQILFLLESFWWGFLDERRNPVRQVRVNLREELRILLSFLAIGSLIFSVQQIYQHVHDHRIYSIFDLLFTLELFRFGLSTLSMTYQAPLQAKLRTPFPISNLLVVELVSLAILFFAFRFLGPWAIPLSVAVQIILKEGLRWKRILSLYQILKLQPEKRLNRGKISYTVWPTQLKHGLGSVLIRFDHFILLMLFFSFVKSDGNRSAAFVLQIVSPLFKLSGDWARVLFFDLRRGQSPFQKFALDHMLSSAFRFGFALSLILFFVIGVMLPDVLPYVFALTIVRSAMTLELFTFYLLDEFAWMLSAVIPIAAFFMLELWPALIVMALWIAISFRQVRKLYSLPSPDGSAKISFIVNLRLGIRTHTWISLWREGDLKNHSSVAWVGPRKILLGFADQTVTRSQVLQLLMSFAPGTVNEVTEASRLASPPGKLLAHFQLGQPAPTFLRALTPSQKFTLLQQAFESALLRFPVKSQAKLPYRAHGAFATKTNLLEVQVFSRGD